MAGLPAHCDHCGLTFVSNFISVENARDITFQDIAISCPRCGGTAHGVDGRFDFLGEAIKVKSAPPRTLAILEVLQEALRAAQAGEEADRILARMEQAAPEFAPAAHAAVKKGGLVTLIALLVYLLTNCSAHVQQSLDWNQLIDQAHVYLTGSDPYPGLGQKEARSSEPERKRELSRQQRRQQERQAKKQQQRSERPVKRKPKH